MKLTEKQRDALRQIYNKGWIDEDDTFIHKNTIYSLHRKELIASFNYANCSTWELTDKGLTVLGVA